MPSIAFADNPNSGETLDSDEYRANVHRETPTSQVSYAIVNGRLDHDNFDTGEKPTYAKVREGTFSRPTFVGSTLNIDIFKEMSFIQGGLGGYIQGTRDSNNDSDPSDGFVQAEIFKAMEEQGQIILAIAWYNPYAVSQVNLSWGLAVSCHDAVTWAEEADNTTAGWRRWQWTDRAFLGELDLNVGIFAGWPPSGGYENTFTGETGTASGHGCFPSALAGDDIGTKAMLFVDDEPVGGVQRNFGDGANAYADEGPVAAPVAGITDEPLYEDKAADAVVHADMRFWSGALTVDSDVDSGALTKGWHTASIRILTDRRVVRIHSRRMLAHAIR